MIIRWRRIEANLRYRFRISRPGSSAPADGTRLVRLLVEVEKDGVVGRGEIVPVPYYGHSLEAVEARLAESRDQLTALLAGLFPDHASITGLVDGMIPRWSDQRCTLAGLDAALHDWWGRTVGAPAWQLLGCDPANTPPTSMTLGLDEPDVLAEKASEAVAGGFRALKIKVGTRADEANLRLIREVAPTQRLRVDANCGWSPENMRERAALMKQFGVELIEQPLPAQQLRDVAGLRGTCDIPLFADEDCVVPGDVERLAGVYDGINIKLVKCGGIVEARRMIRAARDHGLQIMLGCMTETSLGVSAGVALASLVDFVDLDAHLLLNADPFGGLRLVNGVVLPGEQPGLGVTESG